MKSKANETSFKKGRSGNPGGRAKLPEDIKQKRSEEYAKLITDIIEVRNITECPEGLEETLPLGKRRIYQAYKDGDAKAVKDYEDRLFGKAQESIDLNHSGDIAGRFEIILNPVNAD